MISVIVPTYNREGCLYSMLKSINRQNIAEFEVIVIDQSEVVSEDKISKILKSCRNVKYYNIDKKGRPLAKNFGIQKATKKIVVFCDDDIIAEDDFLSEHLRIHQSYENIGAASCHLIEPHQKVIDCSMPLKITSYGRFINVPNSSFNGFVTSLNGGNMSFKYSALQEIGYFDENLRGTSMLEEPDIAYRLLKKGYKLYFSSSTCVKHFPQYNGNVTIKSNEKKEWLRSYFFNQYFFMFKNKRQKYFLLLLIYLSYRSIVESLKVHKGVFKFLDLPYTAFWKAFVDWHKKKKKYNRAWYTPCNQEVTVVKYKAA